MAGTLLLLGMSERMPVFLLKKYGPKALYAINPQKKTRDFSAIPPWFGEGLPLEPPGVLCYDI